MKKLLNISVILLFGIFAAGSCTDDKTTEDTASACIEKSDSSFGVDGGTGTILVSAKGNITATSDMDWCKVSVDGKTVNLTVTVNEEIMGRTALVSIHADGQTLCVPVSQKGVVFYVSVNELTYPLSGGSQDVQIKSNMQYSIHIPDNVTWVRYIFVENDVRITATAATAQRSTKVEIRAGNAVKEIVINQN